MATAPGLVLTLVGGVIADKVDRKRLLIYTQAGAGLSALTLALLVWEGAIRWEGAARRPGDVWMVLLLSFVTGCCWALSGPSYQAITVDLVEREDLANAIALNSSQFQLARVAGPTLAAVTLHALGMAGCFLANGLSYAAIVAALARVKFERRSATVGKEPVQVGKGALAAGRSMWGDLAEGFRYVRGRPGVRAVLVCSTVVCLFGTPYLVLLPLFARNVYGWGESGLSLLMGTAGAGALVGALTLAYRGDMSRKGLTLLAAMLSGGTCIVCFAVAPSPWAAVPLLFGTGMSMVTFFALGNTLLQQLVTDEMRGRVMSMWLLTFIGTTPFASLLSGAAADRFGPRPTLAACGLVVLLFGLAAGLLNARLREL
jgi:MFS family permease